MGFLSQGKVQRHLHSNVCGVWRVLLGLVAAGSLAAAGHVPASHSHMPTTAATRARGATPQQKQWWGTSPSDRCTPYDLNGRKDMDQMCADMAGWSDEHLAKLWNASAIPTAAEGFPLRGCSYRCVAGSNWLAQMAQRPMVNAGWSGKCFGFSLNQTTGTPLGLINQFSEHYDKRSLPSNLRVAGKVQGTASVFWDSTSIADGKPVWAFDYSQAPDIYYSPMDARMVVNGIRDEVRQVADGYLLGRMHLINEKPYPIPLYFVLFQACTEDYTFPSSPDTRALPPLRAA
ncbi:hypothetical protein OEZ86_011129 [Tetradesmus obliquus]|nr:hypothetical protein OEZ86_011129 [Tetradesmus obliquus]